jgi:hypothetical protein
MRQEFAVFALSIFAATLLVLLCYKTRARKAEAREPFVGTAERTAEQTQQAPDCPAQGRLQIGRRIQSCPTRPPIQGKSADVCR